MSLSIGWLIAAAFIVVALAGYAISLQQQLKKRDRENARQVEALVAEQAARRESAVQSIVIIARAMQQQQCATSEGCIRLSALLSQIDSTNQDSTVYSPFFQVADALSHIPILAQWKSLERKQQDAFVLEIKSVEDKFQTFVEPAISELLKEYAPLPDSPSSAEEKPDSAVQYFG